MSEDKNMNEFEALGAMVANDVLDARGMGRVGVQYDGERDIEKALGYTRDPGHQDFRKYYDNRGIASVIVDRPAHDTWRKSPEITDGSGGKSSFMKGWSTLVENYSVFHYLERLDRLAGIGHYGALLLGINDANGDNMELRVDNATGLNYLMPFWEGKADVEDFQEDAGQERFGRPTLYDLDFSLEELEQFDIKDESQKKVHHSRVIHVAEGLLDNEVYGEPRLKKVFHRLQDLDKLIGAAPEGFWQQATKGYHVSEKEGANLQDPEDFDDITEEMQKFLNGFKRVVTTSGVDVQELAGETSMDPSNPFDIVITTISVKTGIPKRILMGSEKAELASSQDRKNWFDQIENRQTQFAQPMILERFVDRLVDIDILDPPHQGGYSVNWPNLWTPTKLEQAEIIQKKAAALNKASGGMPAALMPKKMILKELFGFDDDTLEEYDLTDGPTEDEMDQAEVDEENEQVQNEFNEEFRRVMTN